MFKMKRLIWNLDKKLYLLSYLNILKSKICDYYGIAEQSVYDLDK